MRDTRESPAPRRRRLLRLLVTTNGLLIVVGLLALTVVGGRVAFAYWTAQATATAPPPLVSGTLDYELRSATTGAVLTEASPDLWTDDASFTFTNAFPGESYAYAFTVANTGTTSFTLDVSIHTMQANLNPYLVANTYYSAVGGTAAATNSGTSPRSGTCAGTPSSANQIVLTSTSPGTDINLPTSSDYVLDATETLQVCVVLQLLSTAPSSIQGYSAPQVRLHVTTTQVAP